MATTYPATKQTFSDPAGTSLVTSPDHAVLHTNINDTVEAIQDTVGTTLGTNVLMHMAAGNFPARVTGVAATGTIVQTLVGGTLSQNVLSNTQGTLGFLNKGTLGSVQSQGGTFNNFIMGSPNGTGGTLANIQLIGTPQITGGTLNSGVLGTPTVVAPNFFAYATATQAIPAAVFTKVTYPLERHDLVNNFATASSEFVTPVAGVYFFSACAAVAQSNANQVALISLFHNGTEFIRGGRNDDIGTSVTHSLSFNAIGSLGANGTLDVRVYLGTNGSVLASGTFTGDNYFQGYKIG